MASTACCVCAQEAFQNLNFEMANPIPLVDSPYYPHAVASSNGIPNWTVYLGASTTDWLFLNTVSLGAAAISLQSSTSDFPPIAGNYSVGIQSSVGVEPTSAAVGQIGQIPATAKSLRFYGSTAMQVTFGGQLLSLVELGTGPRYQVVGADISAFAGQTGELKFLMAWPGTPGSRNGSFLDNIEFSTIPEPCALAVAGLGAALLALRPRSAPL